MRFAYSWRKMAKLFANSGEPDQMPHSAASDLGLRCLPITLLRVSLLQWFNNISTHMGHFVSSLGGKGENRTAEQRRGQERYKFRRMKNKKKKKKKRMRMQKHIRNANMPPSPTCCIMPLQSSVFEMKNSP